MDEHYDDDRDEPLSVSAHLAVVLELTRKGSGRSAPVGMADAGQRQIWRRAESANLAEQLGLDYHALGYTARGVCGTLLIRCLDEALKHGYQWTVDHTADGNPAKIADRLVRDLDVREVIEVARDLKLARSKIGHPGSGEGRGHGRCGVEVRDIERDVRQLVIDTLRRRLAELFKRWDARQLWTDPGIKRGIFPAARTRRREPA